MYFIFKPVKASIFVTQSIKALKASFFLFNRRIHFICVLLSAIVNIYLNPLMDLINFPSRSIYMRLIGLLAYSTGFLDMGAFLAFVAAYVVQLCGCIASISLTPVAALCIS